jgi:serine/threonine-protein kinase
MSSNPDQQRIGKYEVQGALSSGKHARVFKGLDPETRKVMALKVIPRANLKEPALAAFRKYAQALQKLDHPGIVKSLDVVESDKWVCIVSEIAEGVPLSSLLKDGAHPDIKNVWDVARRILEILAFAHARGAVHRDLKPANVFLAPGGSVAITDFGVSTLYAGPPETIAYRAPEHFAADGQVTARSDIYQAGAIIYQLITGKLPFSGTPEEIEHRVHQERPSDPSSFNNKIAWQLDWVLQKALSKDAAERFNAAIDFAEGLRLGLQDTVGRPLEPIVQPPPPAPAAPASTPETATPAAPAPQPAAVAKPAAPPPGSPVRQPTKPPVTAAPKGPTAAAAPIEPAPAIGKPGAGAQLLAQKAQAIAKAAAPAAAAKPAVADAPAQAEAQSPKVRILLVDDEERIVNGVKALLRQDYDVVTALGGEAALAALKQGTFHVIVSDQRMPGITGVELLRQARTLAPNAVRMLLTGYTDLAALVGSINQGEIFKFVMKPWDNDELRKSIADAARIAMELAASAAPAGTEASKPANPRSAGSILVIDPKEGLAKGLERLLAGAAEVIQVPTPQEAGKVLQGREIAAIVADLGAGTDGLVALFRQLKEKRPEVLSILIAEEPDSELGIELINKAQIYRFLPKPVSAKELRTQVAAALRRYATIKQIKAGGKPSVAAERARASPDRPPGGG